MRKVSVWKKTKNTRREKEKDHKTNFAVDDLIDCHGFEGSIVVETVGIGMQVGAEPEALVCDSASAMSLVHVLVDL